MEFCHVCYNSHNNGDYFPEHHYQVDLSNGGRVFSVLVNFLLVIFT
jgi:hypothetical protein